MSNFPCFLAVWSAWLLLWPVESATGNDVHKNLLSLKEGRVIFHTDLNFLSFSIDAIHLEKGVKTMKLTDPKLISLTKHLSPAYLRVGGIAADRLLFARTSNVTPKINTTDKYFTGDDFLALHKFARLTNTQLIFDLNVLHRTKRLNQETNGNIAEIAKKKEKEVGTSGKAKLNEETNENIVKNEIHDRIKGNQETNGNIDEGEKQNSNVVLKTVEHEQTKWNIDDQENFLNNEFETSDKAKDLFNRNKAETPSESSWNSSNAAELVKFCEEQGLRNHWQLGNEPNAYLHQFNISVSPEQLAKDYLVLKSLLSQSTGHDKDLLIGPDVTRFLEAVMDDSILSPNKYLDRFLSSQGTEAVSAVGVHQYYLNRNATLADYLDPATFDLLSFEISKAQEILARNYENHAEKAPLWLSETGSCVQGGNAGLSDTFAASFLWIDKLGLAAKMRVAVVIRQSLEFGKYSFVENDVLTPNPDWWLSVLYKRLVDPRVLDIFIPLSHRTLRLYSHCSPTNNITVFGINSGLYEERLYFDTVCYVDLYLITQQGEDLRTKEILLNYNPLGLYSDGSLPDLIPIRYRVRHGSYIAIPVRSIVFLEIQLDIYQPCNN